MDNITTVEETTQTPNSLVTLGQRTVSEIVSTVQKLPIMKEEDSKFLMEHQQHLGMVMENTHMWRTNLQKKSIINDLQHPTLHSKFHQAILEQKVQFDQTMYLAKDFEMKKFEIEELECDLEDLDKDDVENPENVKRNDIKRRKIILDMQFKQYELKQMQIAMNYRMAEVKGWQMIEEDLLEQLRTSGMSEEDIWHKDAEETENMFFLTMNNLRGIDKTTDSGEFNNLVSLAAFTYKTAEHAGMLDKLIEKANPTQLESINFIKRYIANKN